MCSKWKYTDPTGKYLALSLDNTDQPVLFKIPEHKQVCRLDRLPCALSPDGRYSAANALSAADQPSLSPYDTRTNRLLIRFEMDAKSQAGAAAFSDDGRLLAWDGGDGTVRLCELNQVRQRLKTLGLDWRD